MKQIEEKVRNIFKINDNAEYPEEVFEYIYSRRNVKSVKTLIKYNLPSSYSILYKNLKRLQEIGVAFTLEKMIICNGEELGKKKHNERIRKYGITLENMILKYGEEEGKRKYKSYCEKQAYTNSYEYKNKKYGMTKEEYNNYNKRRAITLENMILKYGEEEGKRKYKSYCEKQAYTNSIEYLGKERYEKINKEKARTINNYIKKYGEEEGKKKFYEYIANNAIYSKISQQLFTSLMELDIIKGKVYYGKSEYGIMNVEENLYYKYDFVAPEHELCIEFHGDHYHGNPRLYRPDDFLKGRGCTKIKAKDKWKLDEIKINFLKQERGFDTIVVWELDYKQSEKDVIDRIIDYVKNKV